MKTSSYRKKDSCWPIALYVIGLIFLVMGSEAYAQVAPMYSGELEIKVLPAGTLRTIIVSAVGDVYDTRCNWYQRNSELSYWQEDNTDNMLLQFVDRLVTCPHSPPDDPRFGYGLYLIYVGSAYIYVDFRDADYGTQTGYTGYQDMHLSYTPPDNFFRDWINDRTIPLGETFHIWDMEPKEQDTYPLKVPVTVRNSFQGGSVKINDVSVSCPRRTTWAVDGSVKVEAIDPQQYYGTTYYFLSWSDGGARIHYITPTLGMFATTLTANYTSQPARPLPGGVQSEAYPNPFNPVATIRYSLPISSFTTLEVFTVLGEKIATLVREENAEGMHEVQFDATNLASGLYFYRLSAAGEMHLKKILLSK